MFTRVLLALCLLSLSAFAQEIQNEFKYKDTVLWNQKPYDIYQTPQGDNVLVGKNDKRDRERAEKEAEELRKDQEQARREADKRARDQARGPRNGIYLFDHARKVLSQEGLFEVGFSTGYRQMGSAETLEADRQAALAADRSVTSSFDSIYLPWRPVEGVSNKGTDGQLFLAFRLPFYRHVRVSAGVVDGFFKEYAPERGLVRGGITTKTSKPGQMFEIDHDVWVFPSEKSLAAISVGYFAAQNFFTYQFEGSCSVITQGLNIGSYRCGQAVSSGPGSHDLPNNRLVDTGWTASVRKVWLNEDGVNFAVEGKSRFGQKGSRSFAVQVKLGFGGRKF